MSAPKACRRCHGSGKHESGDCKLCGGLGHLGPTELGGEVTFEVPTAELAAAMTDIADFICQRLGPLLMVGGDWDEVGLNPFVTALEIYQQMTGDRALVLVAPDEVAL